MAIIRIDYSIELIIICSVSAKYMIIIIHIYFFSKTECVQIIKHSNLSFITELSGET